MASFNKTFDRNRSFSNRDRRNRERPQMHEAICSDCGKKCEIPFKPSSDKPIYCNQCFAKHGGNSRSNNHSERGSRERFKSDRQMFDAICSKCGKNFELPFRPTGEKPVYCNECFNKDGNNYPVIKNISSPSVNQYKEQFDILNVKLDKILKVLCPTLLSKELKPKVIIEKAQPISSKNKKSIVKENKRKVVKKEKIEKPAKNIVKKNNKKKSKIKK